MYCSRFSDGSIVFVGKIEFRRKALSSGGVAMEWGGGGGGGGKNGDGPESLGPGIESTGVSGDGSGNEVGVPGYGSPKPGNPGGIG